MTEALRGDPALQICVSRVLSLDPAAAFDALQRGLERVPTTRQLLAPTLAGVTSGAALAQALRAGVDPRAGALALVVLWEVDPAAASPVIASLQRLGLAHSREETFACLLSLPPELVAAAARQRGLSIRSGEIAGALVKRGDDASWHEASQIVERTEGDARDAVTRLRASFDAPAVPQPVWQELRDQLASRLPLSGFVEAVAAGDPVGGWDDSKIYAARPDLASPAARLELLQQLASRVASSQLERLVVWLIARVAEEKASGAESILASIVLGAPDRDRGKAAMKALAAKKTPAAGGAFLDILQALQRTRRDAPTPRHVELARVAAFQLIDIDPEGMDTAAPFLAAPAIERDLDRAIATGFLDGAAAIPKKKWDKVAESWAALALPLLGGPVDAPARGVLNRLSAPRLVELIPAPPPAVIRSPSNPLFRRGQPGPGWLERYDAGEHALVWREMRAAGSAVRDVKGAAEVASRTMERLRTDLERLVKALKEGGCVFRQKDPITPPEKGSVKVLAAIHSALGSPLPLSFRAFHEAFGAVDLTLDDGPETRPEFRRLCDRDPLQIVPCTVTRDYLVKAAAQARKEWAEPLRLAPRLFLGVGLERKASPEQQDGSPHELEAFGLGADGLVIHGRRTPVYFIDHLRATLANGGFGDLADQEHGVAVRALLTAGRSHF